MRPTLVAEAPCRRGNRVPLDGAAGDRLARHAGLGGRAQLLEAFDAVNLLGRWPGGSGKGAAWPRDRARRAAARKPLRGTCVLLGRRVADAYAAAHPQLRGVAWGEWTETRRARVAVVPHPSGIVRAYNDPEMRALAGRVLSEALA